MFISASSNLAAGNHSFSITASNTTRIRTSQSLFTFAVAASPKPHPQLVNTSNLFVVESAREDEHIVSQSGELTGPAQVFSFFSSVEGTVTPITYTSGGADIDFVKLSVTNNTASLLLNQNVSGSAKSAGDNINFSITASDAFGNISQSAFTVSVQAQTPPSFSLVQSSSEFNTNLARPRTTSTNPNIDNNLYEFKIS